MEGRFLQGLLPHALSARNAKFRPTPTLTPSKPRSEKAQRQQEPKDTEHRGMGCRLGKGPIHSSPRSRLGILWSHGASQRYKDGVETEGILLCNFELMIPHYQTTPRIACHLRIFITPIITLWEAWWRCIMFLCIKKKRSVLTCKHLRFPMVFLILICIFSLFKYIRRLKLWKQPSLLSSEMQPEEKRWSSEYQCAFLATRKDFWNSPGVGLRRNKKGEFPN